MKSFDNTIPLVLLELVVGAIFLLAILVSVPLLHDRVDSMSAIGLAVPTDTESEQYKKAKEESKAAVAALRTVIKRVDDLTKANKAAKESRVQLAKNSGSQEEVEEAINQHLKPVLSRFDALENRIESHFSTLKEAADAAIAKKDEGEAIESKEDDLLPLFAKLNNRTDSLLSEHENNILPNLIRLNDNIDILMQESQRDTQIKRGLPRTTVVPVLKKGADNKVLRSIQATLKNFNLESKIGPGGGSLLLSDFFDFNRFATTLNDQQVAGLAKLADALAMILPCYTKPAPGEVVKECQTARSKIGLDAVMIQSFSLGGNVGTLRINYNSNLANTRSIYILKILLTARPDLLKYFNSKGSPLFVAVGKLALTEDVRSRKIVLQFIMEDNQ
ncbi:MAG: hypothetical protein HQL69_08060 [Magnetococcales bacterium]|nr:hypothetical protein [Magnetococcales bacterium]